MRKTCFKCGEEKPIEDFYRHPKMADGHMGKCKECAKADVRENRSIRRSQYAAYERQRFNEPGRRARVLEAQRQRRAKYPEKEKARQAVRKAIKGGTLMREGCELCGELAEAHHENYSRALEVRWLCFRHHREEHGQIVLRSF